MNPKKSIDHTRENRILNAAAALFIHYGFDKTTVSEIATEAGISKGAIYLHFKSKEALFDALLKREMRAYVRLWLDLIEQDPAGGSMGSLYKNIITALNQVPFMAVLFKRDQRILGSYLQNNQQFTMGTAATIRTEFIQLMQQAGAIRTDVEPKQVAFMMNALAYGLIQYDAVMGQEQPADMDSLLTGIAAMMDRALSPEDGVNYDGGKAVIQQVVAATSQFLEAD